MLAIPIDKPPSMNGMVGIDHLKKNLATMRTGAAYRKIIGSFGAQVDSGFQNALINGAPGTGKTTFAKILAFEYRAAGIVAKDASVYFTSAIDLIGEYIGQSEERTKRLLQTIGGGVLIIDEIDSLLDVTNFGPSVLNTLNVHMGNAVNKPIIIATCYGARKEDLLRANRGLQGRFRHIFEMPYYSIDDLADMFVKKVNMSGLICADDVRPAVKETLVRAQRSKGPLFANAREIQNIFDVTIESHAAWLASQGVDFTSPSVEEREPV